MIQRVNGAKLSVNGEAVASVGRGLVVYVGIEQSDTEADIVAFASKLVALRIFADGDGKMNLSVTDVGGDILLVSNFTLCADISHGNRPSFTGAMRPAATARPSCSIASSTSLPILCAVAAALSGAGYSVRT